MAGTSIFMQCLEGVRDVIRALDLTGLPDNCVVIRRRPHDGSNYFPGITVHPSQERYSGGTTAREAVGYGCAVTMIVNNDNDKDYLLDRLLTWRETIRRKFVEKGALTGVTSGDVYTLKVEHEEVLDWNRLKHDNLDACALCIRPFVLETRT